MFMFCTYSDSAFRLSRICPSNFIFLNKFDINKHNLIKVILNLCLISIIQSFFLYAQFSFYISEVVRAMTYVVQQGWAMYWGTSRWSQVEVRLKCQVYVYIMVLTSFNKYKWLL